MDFGGSGTEGPARINDAWIAYTGFAPFTLQLGAFSPPANLEDGTTPDDLLFIERADARGTLARDGRRRRPPRHRRCAAAGARWMGALTLTSRTVNDAEVFDSQIALVGRVGGLVATGADYNVHLGANGTYVIRSARPGLRRPAPRYGIRFRDRPEIRVDSTRLIDTGTIDADAPMPPGSSSPRTGRTSCCRARTSGTASNAAPRRCRIPRSAAITWRQLGSDRRKPSL